MTASTELAARLRADVDALREDIERLHELPEPDRLALEEPLLASVQRAGEALRLAFHRVAGPLAAADESPDLALVAQSKDAVGPTGEWRLMLLRVGEHRVAANVHRETGQAVLLNVQADGRAPNSQPDLASLEGLVHQLSPALDIESPVEVLQARRNAEARALLLSEFGGLTSAQVADLLSSKAKNRSALAHRWRKERRLLAVVYRGAVWFPGFQFHDGAVVPVIRDVLEVLAGAGRSEWETALWFTAPNGWLDDRRPVDLLVEHPDQVLDAAHFEVAGFGG